MLTPRKLFPFIALLFVASFASAQKVAVVDVQKVFDGYQKVKDARDRLEKSKKIAMEELQIFRAEMEKRNRALVALFASLMPPLQSVPRPNGKC